MKKIIVALVALFSCGVVAAQPGSNATVNYYGVDFSGAKTFGFAESPQQIRHTFYRINLLIINEWAKYSPERHLGVLVDIEDIEVTNRLNVAIDPASVRSTSRGYTLSDDDIAAMVQRYTITETAGTGLVFVCELLDKQSLVGSWHVIRFDIASREVLQSQCIVGKPGGFGLRNFWARSLYNALAR